MLGPPQPAASTKTFPGVEFSSTSEPITAAQNVASARASAASYCGRAARLSAWQSFCQRADATVLWILGVATSLVLLFLTILALQNAFSFGPIRPWEWLAAFAAVVAGVAWFEIYKTLARR